MDFHYGHVHMGVEEEAMEAAFDEYNKINEVYWNKGSSVDCAARFG